jgi:hypothetical protein
MRSRPEAFSANLLLFYAMLTTNARRRFVLNPGPGVDERNRLILKSLLFAEGRDMDENKLLWVTK